MIYDIYKQARDTCFGAAYKARIIFHTFRLWKHTLTTRRPPEEKMAELYFERFKPLLEEAALNKGYAVVWGELAINIADRHHSRNPNARIRRNINTVSISSLGFSLRKIEGNEEKAGLLRLENSAMHNKIYGIDVAKDLEVCRSTFFPIECSINDPVFWDGQKQFATALLFCMTTEDPRIINAVKGYVTKRSNGERPAARL